MQTELQTPDSSGFISKVKYGFYKKAKPNKKTASEQVNDFQTPPAVCRYMVSLLPKGALSILEPTRGKGNIVEALKEHKVTAPDDFFLMDKSARFDGAVMNPPFSTGSAIMTHAPKGLDLSGMKVGYYILTQVMEMTDTVIALMPFFTLTDSDVRLRYFKSFGIRSITALPRKTFGYVRIQTCIIHLEKGFKGTTEFKVYEFLPEIEDSLDPQYKIF